MSILENFELTTEQLQEPETKQRFKIENLSSLGWTFRRIKAEQEKKAKIMNYAYTETTRIRDWQEKETAPIDNTINFFQSLITEYATEQRKADPKFKQSTPYGGVNFKKQQPKWEWQDDVALAKQFLPEDKLAEVFDLINKLQEEAGGMVRLKISLEPEKNAIKKFKLIPDWEVETTDKGEIKKAKKIEGQYLVLSPDGEVLPGIVVKEQGEKLEIKPC